MAKFLVGAAVGFIAGLLMAPDKGENTRDNIAATAEKLKYQLNRLMGKTEADIDDLRAVLDQEISGLSEDVKNRILTILDEAEELAYSPKGHLSNGVV